MDSHNFACGRGGGVDWWEAVLGGSYEKLQQLVRCWLMSCNYFSALGVRLRPREKKREIGTEREMLEAHGQGAHLLGHESAHMCITYLHRAYK